MFANETFTCGYHYTEWWKYYAGKNKTAMNNELSYENTMRLLDHRSEVNKAINDIIYADIVSSAEDVRKEINKAVSTLAEERGVNIYDICLSTTPKLHPRTPIEHYDELSPTVEFSYWIELEPLVLEFEKGPGYWKGKYFALKRKIQDILDEKSDGLQKKD